MTATDDFHPERRDVSLPPGWRYLRRVPRTIPADRLLAHNVLWSGRMGLNGFRAWTVPAEDADQYQPCDCGWAEHLGPHFQTKRGRGRPLGNQNRNLIPLSEAERAAAGLLPSHKVVTVEQLRELHRRWLDAHQAGNVRQSKYWHGRWSRAAASRAYAP